MKSMAFSADMHGDSISRTNQGAPVHPFRGKLLKKHLFGSPAAFLMAMFLLGCACRGLSEERPLVSVPLGFQIFGYEKFITWTSQNGVFAFGFLRDYESDDAGFVVGIWYNLRNIGESVPVWVVGAGVRVSENSTLQLSMDGSLVLVDFSRHGLPVWSSSTAYLGVETATLMNNGNLVLMGSGDRVVWESFNSPTDTLLPGQPLSFPQSLQASLADSASSYYSFEINKRSGDISLVWEDNVTYWSSHLSQPVDVREVHLEADGLLGLFDVQGGLAWFCYTEDYKDPFVAFRRLRIDADGNLRIYSWNNASSSWKVSWQAVPSQCHVFGFCGLYHVCRYNSSGPSCECLLQDSASGDCEKLADLGNCNTGITMLVLKQTFLYSLYPPHDFDMMLSLDACRSYCLNDSSCFAVTAKNDGSGLCTIKRTSFISGYRYSSVPATSFLKVCLVPEAVSAQAANLHGNTLPLDAKQHLAQIVGHKSFMVGIVVLLLITASVFFTVEIIIVWFVLYRRRQTKIERRKDFRMNPHYSAMVRLSLEEVKELTKNFGNKLGPSIYKGMLPNKILVAVKVIGNAVVSERDFLLLVSTLGSTHHKNLVALKGYCYELAHKVLVYEYISNGSLDQWLLNRKHCRGKDGWHQRLNISIGIARALSYLHLECKQCIPHGNLKLENVLLDENMIVKVTYYGLHALLQKDVASSSESPLERDIYMLGRILLHIFAENRFVDDDKLCNSAYQMCKVGKLCQFVDPHLSIGDAELEEMERVVRLALWCMQNKPSLRPSIAEVVMVLEGSLSLDMPPENEAFSVGFH
ncbi:G-type lectin S-receptor-like serine/threonine-protein kinase SD3-1 [Dendrobium catenatum]|uniref:Receptor-like serine/threonine-protein kinase n=1 Tax=Dendrobium catenatum TaxID=906689 RepID=A0A2I0VN57_9ASPA|nr:G-type lectin S-receptor-like serine/threonine-protein kinase SD3-1 [Dendrobium catenatum]